MGTLTSPQAIFSWTSSVSTTKRSCGERPVYWPVVTASAPVLVRVPSPLSTAFSMRTAGEQSIQVMSSVCAMP